jgi:glutathione S-transferase
MLVIWGRKNSVNVQKVLWCCEEMKLEYRRIDAGGAFGVVDTYSYRKLNPNGLVPTIEDGGFVLWESNAIVRYLAAKHSSGHLWPDDLTKRADSDRWMDWSTSTFWPAMRPLFLGLVRTAPEKRDTKALEDARIKTAGALTVADGYLSAHEFLGGERFTMGDIPLGCGIWRWLSLPIERPKLGSVQRWFDSLAERPAYRDVVMHPLS